MKIFVASWFYPPSTSSEGIVTYKLLRNSKHQYDVCSSSSKQWGYRSATIPEASNVRQYIIETDDIDYWVQQCIQCFEKLYSVEQYDCIMTRSMPPESILVGKYVKEKYPNIRWIASFADPIANNPYELSAYIGNCGTLNENQKTALKNALRNTDEAALKPWEERPEPGIKLLCKLKKWENAALRLADLIISPTACQLRYMAGSNGWLPKFFALPHSFEPSFYRSSEETKRRRIVFSYVGYSDKIRSLEPLVRAVRFLQQSNSPALGKIEMRFIGNNPRILKDMVLNYHLYDIIQFEPDVDYYGSLERMQEADWLILVDAFFHEIRSGGSVFFAGKLADYLGTCKPVLALTGRGSPADEIVEMAGGLCLNSWNIETIALSLEKIALGKIKPEIDTEYRKQFSSVAVAQMFDDRLDTLFGQASISKRTMWPPSMRSNLDKEITICVPSYNVERYLDRCLYTLVNHQEAANIEILVVDDGSQDHTAQIARQYEVHYPGIVRLIQKENGGHGSTINRALQDAIGRYFMIVDGDDWVDGDQFAKLIRQIQNDGIDCDIISSNYHEVDMETGISSPWIQKAEVKYFKKTLFQDLDLENVYFTLASSLIKTEVLRQMNMPLQEHTFYVDVEYILFPVPYLHTVMFTDYFIYKYCRGNMEQSVYIPSMVKRYDHHDRVMRRVLTYEHDCKMDPYQQKYYDGILKRLLYTHYSLTLTYDPDKEEGYVRCRDFDKFLKTVNPQLFKWIGKQMRMVRVARRHDFDFYRTEHSVETRLVYIFRKGKNAIKIAVCKTVHAKVFRRLFFNRFTAMVARGRFFQKGLGYSFKQKIHGLIRF